MPRSVPPPHRVTWTVTATEYDQILRAAIQRAVLLVGAPVMVSLGALSIAGGLVGGWTWFGAVIFGHLVMTPVVRMGVGRSMRRVFSATYPVGATVSSEFTAAALVLRTPAGAMELPWDRFGRRRVGPALVAVKDRVSRHWMFFPRVLLPDAWWSDLDP